MSYKIIKCPIHTEQTLFLSGNDDGYLMEQCEDSKLCVG